MVGAEASGLCRYDQIYSSGSCRKEEDVEVTTNSHCQACDGLSS